LLLVTVPNCSRELLEDAGIDEEFERGLLWFSHPSGSVEAQACNLFRSRLRAGTKEENLCAAEYEVLSCEGDGRMIVWCSPHRSEAEFDEWFAKARSSFGVRVHIRQHNGPGKSMHKEREEQKARP
jgi:hypothetical protein